jgi:hypothetical protein
MHNHIRHSADMVVRRKRFPRVDRQQAVARFQALPVRLVWPAALQ